MVHDHAVIGSMIIVTKAQEREQFARCCYAAKSSSGVKLALRISRGQRPNTDSATPQLPFAVHNTIQYNTKQICIAPLVASESEALGDSV